MKAFSHHEIAKHAPSSAEGATKVEEFEIRNFGMSSFVLFVRLVVISVF
jgi:hypothetical protein